jgi:hypothetical protein
MSPTPTLYYARPDGDDCTVMLEKTWEQSGAAPLATGYRHMVPIAVGGQQHLIAVDAKGEASVFRVGDKDPWLAPVASKLDLGGPWDIIEPFQMGNVPHLLAYRSEDVQFSFVPLGDDLSSGAPYDYGRRREPGTTKGFDVAQPFTVNGAVYYLCYSFDGGNVFIYSLAVTATSPPSSAPLISQPVWLHQWARKWTRFAFFELGGETFFLKTNVGKLNVNIDHVLDNPSEGTVEVGTYLDLKDALDLDICRSFYLGGGDPYFVTYMENGETTVNRFNGDCKGWVEESRDTTLEGATQIVPFQIEQACYLLFY